MVIRGLDIGGYHGGAERFGIELAKTIDPGRYQVSVCAFFRHKTATEKFWEGNLEEAKIKYFYATDWKGKYDILNYFRGVQTLKNQIAINHIDICHSHFDFGTMALLYGKLRYPGLRLIRTAHLKPDWGKGIYCRLRKWIFIDWIYPLWLNAEIGVSKHITESLNNSPGSKIFKRQSYYIPNAIAVNRSPTLRDALMLQIENLGDL